MSETTEQFIERFKATGLDMLCEARRRAEQSLPWQARVRTGRTIWKSQSVGRSIPGAFLDLDYSGIEERLIAMTTPSGPYRDPFRRLFTPDPARYTVTMDAGEILLMDRIDPDLMVITGRRMGQSLDHLAVAFARARQTFGNWHFREPIHKHQEPELRTLWPGVKAQVEGNRRVNPKRVAKERLKKKLAKKRK